jgi:hypothetical protein
MLKLIKSENVNLVIPLASENVDDHERKEFNTYLQDNIKVIFKDYKMLRDKLLFESAFFVKENDLKTLSGKDITILILISCAISMLRDVLMNSDPQILELSRISFIAQMNDIFDEIEEINSKRE